MSERFLGAEESQCDSRCRVVYTLLSIRDRFSFLFPLKDSILQTMPNIWFALKLYLSIYKPKNLLIAIQSRSVLKVIE